MFWICMYVSTYILYSFSHSDIDDNFYFTFKLFLSKILLGYILNGKIQFQNAWLIMKKIKLTPLSV